MRRVLQTRFGYPGGNCQQAALASLLELPLEDVPDFCNRYPSDWDQEMNRWLYGLGLFSLHLREPDDKHAAGSLEWLTDNVPCIVAVKSLVTTGRLHAVIYHKGHVIHDPHPSQVHRWREVEVVGYDVMVPLDAARAVSDVQYEARVKVLTAMRRTV